MLVLPHGDSPQLFFPRFTGSFFARVCLFLFTARLLKLEVIPTDSLSPHILHPSPRHWDSPGTLFPCGCQSSFYFLFLLFCCKFPFVSSPLPIIRCVDLEVTVVAKRIPPSLSSYLPFQFRGFPLPSLLRFFPLGSDFFSVSLLRPYLLGNPPLFVRPNIFPGPRCIVTLDFLQFVPHPCIFSLSSSRHNPVFWCTSKGPHFLSPNYDALPPPSLGFLAVQTSSRGLMFFFLSP